MLQNPVDELLDYSIILLAGRYDIPLVLYEAQLLWKQGYTERSEQTTTQLSSCHKLYCKLNAHIIYLIKSLNLQQ